MEAQRGFLEWLIDCWDAQKHLWYLKAPPSELDWKKKELKSRQDDAYYRTKFAFFTVMDTHAEVYRLKYTARMLAPPVQRPVKSKLKPKPKPKRRLATITDFFKHATKRQRHSLLPSVHVDTNQTGHRVQLHGGT